jgi:hypothetical protein
MVSARNKLEQILNDCDGESAADAFAEIVEESIEFCGSAEDYFSSLLGLPEPLLQLYAALIFNTTVRMDGLAFAIPRYDNPDFMIAMQEGMAMVGEMQLWSLVERSRAHLLSDSSKALDSKTPNVTLDQELPGITDSYFEINNSLMTNIGKYLRANRTTVLTAADQLKS